MQVVDESLRLFPPGLGAHPTRDSSRTWLPGQAVPAGTLAIISPWLLHRDGRSGPTRWPSTPDRFLGDASTAPRPDYVPFGLGPRLCIGRDFALVESVLVLAALLQRVGSSRSVATARSLARTSTRWSRCAPRRTPAAAPPPLGGDRGNGVAGQRRAATGPSEGHAASRRANEPAR